MIAEEQFPPLPPIRYIKRIGVEIEGGWNHNPYARIVPDGSVTVDARHVGEVNSPPMKIATLLHWINQNYPDVHNSSCGLHVHISLSPLRYSQLMEEGFWNFFRTLFEQWARKNVRASSTFWSRWNGHNTYCKNQFNPDEQAGLTTKREERYLQLNYAYNFVVTGRSRRRGRILPRSRKTLECRVLPVFKDIRISMLAICEYLRIVEAYLASQPRSEKGQDAILLSGPTDEETLGNVYYINEEEAATPLGQERQFQSVRGRDVCDCDACTRYRARILAQEAQF